VSAPAVATTTAGSVAAMPRRGAAASRVAGITVNYAYLRRDLVALAVLAPLMVVLLIVSYFLLQ
jgi:hypothetical protein